MNSSYRYERYEVYFNALNFASKKDKLYGLLQKAIIGESDIKILFKYVKLAENYNMQPLAEEAYRQILIFAPGNLDAIKGVGVSAFYTQTYSVSFQYIKVYNEKTGGDYLTNYIYGELLFYRGNITVCDDYLKKALEQVKELDKNKRKLKSYIVEAGILFRLERGPDAVKIYRDCIKKYPKDLALKLDFADFLLNLNRIDECEKVLSGFPEPKKTNKKRLLAFSSVKHTEDLKASEITIYANLIRVRLFLKNQRLDKAFALMKKLKAVYPDLTSPRFYLDEADTYTLQGNWRKELYYLNKIIERQPTNEVISDRSDEIDKIHSSSLAVNTGLKISQDQEKNIATEFITTERLDIRITDLWKIGLVQEQDYLSSRKIQYSDGKIGSFYGVKQRTELFTEFDFAGNNFLNGSNLKLSYYLGNEYNIANDSGFGIGYKYLDDWGNTQLQLVYKRPYWELPEGVVEGAYRDRVRIGRFLKIFPSLNIYGEFALNHYGVEDANNVGDSISYIFRANYALPITEIQEYVLGNNSRLFLNYDLNSEVFTEINERTNSSGTRYKILPLVDRQVHTGTVSVYKQFSRYLEADAYGGYAYDVLGDDSHGIVFGGRIRYDIFECLVAEFNVDHSIGVTTSTYVGGGLKWYFGWCLDDLMRSDDENKRK